MLKSYAEIRPSYLASEVKMLEAVIIIAIALTASLSMNKCEQTKLIVNEDRKSVKEWSNTNLERYQLDPFINDKCNESENQFISCVAAIDYLAFELDTKFIPPGNFEENKELVFAQKENLIKWLEFYKKEPSKAKRISFTDIIDNKMLSEINPNFTSWALGQLLNGYFTISADPHTHLDPSIKEINNDKDANLANDDDQDDDEPRPNLRYSDDFKSATIKFDNFYPDMCNELDAMIYGVVLNKTKQLTLDLRSNGGGRVSEATCIASLFLGKEKIVTTASFKGEQTVYLGEKEKSYFGKVTILTSYNSASAAELFTGAMKFYKRATIVGSRTYGKGTYQEPFPSSFQQHGVTLYKTLGYYYLPDGRSPQLTGIEPDVYEGVEVNERESDLYLRPLKTPPLLKNIKMSTAEAN